MKTLSRPELPSSSRDLPLVSSVEAESDNQPLFQKFSKMASIE
jgi:hypothetical protein